MIDLGASAMRRKALAVADKSNVTEQEQWFLTLASIYSAITGDYVNTMETGRDNQAVRDTLRKNWLVSDRPTFEQLILRLAIGEKRSIFLERLNMIKKFNDVITDSNMVCHFISKFSLWFACDWYKTKTKEDLVEITKRLELVRRGGNSKKYEAFGLMIKQARKWTKAFEPIGDYHAINSLIGFNAVYLVSLARFAVQVYLIERNEFLDFVNPIQKYVQRAYNNWQEVALAFAIGNLLDSYSDERLAVLLNGLKLFIENPASPMHTTLFK